MKRWLSILLCLAICSCHVGPAFASPFPDKYDAKIKKASKQWLPGWDWHWWKAQLYQESKLNPEAESWVGAQGIAQFMPGTWAHVAPSLGFGDVSARDADAAIVAGAFYMAQLRRTWSSERPEDDRRELAQASYNAGSGNILKAQRKCNGARDWPTIRECLAQVTGPRNANETITYVDRIKRWFWMMAA